MKVVLTIAGSDSGGGAGIQADLKTFEAHGVFGASVITSITAQNTVEVRQVHELPLDILRAQLEAVFDDLPIAAVKIGMLSSASIIETVADMLELYGPGLPIVLDPVMVSTSGARLLKPDAISSLFDRLVPLSRIVTPNAAEAVVLSGLEIESVTSMIAAARRIHLFGARAVLVKGGDLQPSSARNEWSDDILFDGRSFHRFRALRIDIRSLHGTGCTLSSAITANLATGAEMIDSIRRAKDYVHNAIVHSPAIGSGSRPLRHAL